MQIAEGRGEIGSQWVALLYVHGLRPVSQTTTILLDIHGAQRINHLQNESNTYIIYKDIPINLSHSLFCAS